MNKKALIIVSVAIGLFLVGGGVMAYTNNQNGKKVQEKMATENKPKDEAMMNKDDNAAMSKQGSYVTLADYNKDPSKYADSNKVYFFHASWCSICRNIDKEINADMSRIPSGVTMIKTDFDNSTDLRQKYGVTIQYTFVQVDSSGDEIAQWSATSLEKAIDGIKS